MISKLLENYAKEPSYSGTCEAANAVARVVPVTPLLEIDVNGARVFLKAESVQPMGAFKLRGAWWRLVNLNAEERARGVVAFSSGNHAQGIAWGAGRLGISAKIVMPSDAPKAKIANTRALGAEIIFYDRATEDRAAIAANLSETLGATIIPPFDDPWVIEGQGSAGIEATAQMAALGAGPADCVVACCGGGGLSAGMAISCPEAAITIVEPEGWDDMTRSLATGMIESVGANPPKTACDALMTVQPSPLTFAILSGRDAMGVTVLDEEVEAAMRFAFTNLRIVLEPGGAVALAAVLAGKVRLGAQTLVTLSGGNVDPQYFAAVLSRAA
jgi:threonine dehydratase